MTDKQIKVKVKAILAPTLRYVKRLERENQKLSDQVDRLAARLAAKEAK